MNKKTKKILIVLAIVSTLCASTAYFIGDYFVNYSLVRTTGEQPDSANDPNAPSNEFNSVVESNKTELAKNHDEWVKTIEVNNKSITSNDGLKLNAIEYVVDNTSDKWIVLVHGYTSSNQEMLNRAYMYGIKGYNVLMPNNRAHGDSEGKYIGMGWLDRLDIIKWVNTIVDYNKNAKIVLYGISMGGATVNMVSGEVNLLSENVKAIVSDCAYTTAWDMFVNQLDYRFNLPAFPILNFAHIVANTRIGYDLKDADALSQVKKSTLPILFIHGDIDNYVPLYMVNELYEASNNPNSEILVIEGANHAESDYVNPKLYYETLFNFLDKNVNE